MRRRLPLILLCSGIAVLLLSWSLSSETFTGPDETAHYLRALTLSQGKLLGPRVPYTASSLSPAELAYVNGDSRAVDVPAAMSPGVICTDGQPDTSSCDEASYTGDYFPLPYLLPAVGVLIGHDAIGAMWLARIGSVIPCILLLIGAACALWETDAWSLIGLLGALSPMVLFVCSVLNPSGMETAGTIALAAGFLRISRPTRTPRWIWLLTALAASATVLSFQAGPGFLAAALVLTGGLFTRQRMSELFQDQRRAIGLLAGAAVVGVVLWIVYDAVAGSDHAAISLTPVGHSIYLGLKQVGGVLRDAVGHFGAESIPLPTWSRWVWWLSVGAMVASALAYSDTRGRIVTLATPVVALGFVVVSYAWIYRTTGFELQGREVLGVVTLIPLVCGEVVLRSRRMREGAVRDRARLTAYLPPLAVLGFAAFQAYAWWVNAHISAWAEPGVATPGGVFSFFHFAHWAPPLGWTLWTLAAGAGVILLGLAGFAASRRPVPSPVNTPVPA